jgi:hypothetical protein
MNHPHRNALHRRRGERGAALVMGLLMLVIVTLLAVSAVNTASSELVMAGNEQNRQRAFQAADAAVEPALKTMWSKPQDSVAYWTNNVTMAAATTDKYDYMQQYRGEGPVPDFSDKKFVGLRYNVESRGESPAGDPRAAKQQLWVGAYVVAPSGGGFTNWLKEGGTPAGAM